MKQLPPLPAPLKKCKLRVHYMMQAKFSECWVEITRASVGVLKKSHGENLKLDKSQRNISGIVWVSIEI